MDNKMTINTHLSKIDSKTKQMNKTDKTEEGKN